MDAGGIRAKFNNLQNRVAGKGREVLKFDDKEQDLFPGPGDVYVRDVPTRGDVTMTGVVQKNLKTGDFNRIELEEKGHGGKVQYKYSLKEEKGSRSKTVLMKTDTRKETGILTRRDNGQDTISFEEMIFFESAVSPQLESRSESIKEKVQNVAQWVNLLDNTPADLDPAPGSVMLDGTKVFGPKGSMGEFSGRVTRDPSDGRLSSVELSVAVEGKFAGEYHLVTNDNFDYYKTASPDEAKSTQIFDKNGPKLVLLTEQVTRPLTDE